jgi:hypothetical protein
MVAGCARRREAAVTRGTLILQRMGELNTLGSDGSLMVSEVIQEVDLLLKPNFVIPGLFVFARKRRGAMKTGIEGLTVCRMGLEKRRIRVGMSWNQRRLRLRSPENEMGLFLVRPWLRNVLDIDFRRSEDYESTTDMQKKCLLAGWAVTRIGKPRILPGTPLWKGIRSADGSLNLVVLSWQTQ